MITTTNNRTIATTKKKHTNGSIKEYLLPTYFKSATLMTLLVEMT